MTDVFGMFGNVCGGGGLNVAEYSPRGKVVDITPQMAENALKYHNAKNPRKKISMNTARAYAQDMKRGKWVLNGEAIVIDNDGNIKDEQHRLMAIVLAGITVKSLVVTGVDPEITTFDMGLRRKTNQVLGCGKSLETIANMVISNIRTYSGFPAETIKDYMLEHMDEMNKAISICQHGKVGRMCLCGKRDIQTMVYLMMRNGFDEDELEKFIRATNSGFPVDGRDCSSCVVLANHLRSTTIRSAKNEMLYLMQLVYLAFSDFTARKKRMNPYRPKNTDNAWELMQNVRKMDGLE